MTIRLPEFEKQIILSAKCVKLTCYDVWFAFDENEQYVNPNGLKDWAQIFSGFGLGAAAIRTLRQ